MHLRVQRVKLVQPRVALHNLGLAFTQHLVGAHNHRLAGALGGLLELHDAVHPKLLALVLVQQAQQDYSGALLVAGGDALVLGLSLVQVVHVDQLVPGHALDLVLVVAEVMLAAEIRDREIYQGQL